MATQLELDLGELGRRTGAPPEDVVKATAGLTVVLSWDKDNARRLLLDYCELVGAYGGWVRRHEVNGLLEALGHDPLSEEEDSLLQRSLGSGRSVATRASNGQGFVKAVNEVTTERNAARRRVQGQRNFYRAIMATSSSAGLGVATKWILDQPVNWDRPATLLTILLGISTLSGLRWHRSGRRLEKLT